MSDTPLHKEIEERLKELVLQTDMTKVLHADETIAEFLNDIEDYYLAESRLKCK